MPDLVGVVIPNYIGALSSLAGVVVAIVALITARQARTDAKAAAAEAALATARGARTRDAVRELVGVTGRFATPNRSGDVPSAVRGDASDAQARLTAILARLDDGEGTHDG